MEPASTVATSSQFPVQQIKMKHSLTQIDEAKRTGSCSLCGDTKIKLRDSKATSLAGKYRCIAVYKRNIVKSQYPYAVHKKDACEKCGFIPVHISQLDVDHIDGDRWNNEVSNLQTLCANCHRLKTHLNGDSNSGIF
jgi:5-methylcytosine-specific restriction endonuclease McrA